jgi:RNA polymerase sigma-70 factor, ECF subfamily
VGVEDHEGWERFVQSYYAPIRSFCFHYLGTREDAEDLVQEVFMKAYVARRARADVAKERSWIYAIARNACADRCRSWKRYARMLTWIEPRGHTRIESDLESIRRCVASLPRRQREVFILRHWHGFSTAETARLLSLDDGTVKSHLKRAIDTLKVKLSDQPDGGRDG